MTSLAAALLAVAAALAFRPRVGAPSAHTARADSADEAVLRRLRVPLSLLAGGAAWSFVGGAVGLGLAVVAGAVAWRILGAVESPAARRRRQEVQRHLPFAVHLLSVLVAGGAEVGTALSHVGAAVGGPLGDEFARVARDIALTGRPRDVWARVAGFDDLGPLGRALARSYDSGAPVVDAVAHVADDLTRSAELAVEARVRTIEVRAAIPLGVCFLPAFAVLGVLPLVVGTFAGMSFLR